MITRGTALVTTLAIAASLALAGCGSSGGDNSAEPASDPATGTWFQVRPVLAEKKATGNDCTVVRTTLPNAQPADSVCSQDKTVVYSLGAAVLTENDVDSVGSTDTVVSLGLLPNGKAAFATMTGDLSKQKSPANQFAVLADGVVLTAPSVNSGAITDGMLEVKFEDAAKVEPFMLRVSA